jgi:predicted dehydrogenase
MGTPRAELRVGLLGVGWHGGSHIANFRADRRVRITAICDLNEELLAERARSLEGVGTHTDYREMMARDDVDAVVIALPDHLHAAPALAACEANKHVLLEKPMALTVEDAERIAEAARASRGAFMLNMSNRWLYPFAKGRELIDSGAVGDVRYVFTRLANRIDVPTERLPWLQKSHLAFWIGIHRLDIARWWIAREAVRVRAVQRAGVLSARGFDAADFYQATIEFDGGAVVSLEGNWILPRSFPNMVDSKFFALCTDGMIDVDRMRSELAVSHSAGFELATPTAGPALDQPSGYTLAATRHFVDCALSGAAPLVGPEDGLALTRILCAVVRSAEADGDVVTL